jgi:hypothetical protein
VDRWRSSRQREMTGTALTPNIDSTAAAGCRLGSVLHKSKAFILARDSFSTTLLVLLRAAVVNCD